MNDDNQTKTQAVNNGQTQNQSSQIVTNNPATGNVQIPDNPVSSPHKEQMVSTHGNETVQNQEIIKPSETEPEIDQEVSEAGLQHLSQKPALTQEHIKIGITHSQDSTPVSISPSGIIKLPLTEEEALLNRKKYSISSSFRWFLEGVIRQSRAMKRKMVG